ncbi:hypothetical protein ACHHYP_04903 [Achlya hypogyna]|uniref:Transmembrane protein n=1 Tax=Achlya hypogyna TaxID=1202772 RepID=A0A1V9YZE7_ACHHY|nr:hypothetical protein ACHHYP_04903 [Achlya hypogyna]
MASNTSEGSMLSSTRRLSLSSSWLTNKKPQHDGSKRVSRVALRVWVRIGANLGAFSAIYASLAFMSTLLAMGALGRRTLAPRAEPDKWQPLGQSCELIATGFVPHSCSPSEVVVLTTAAAWSALGTQLAQNLRVPLGSQLKVTSCTAGCTDDTPQASLQLLIGASHFPECNPTTGGQPVVAVGLVEAVAVSDANVNDAYLLTLFVDATTTRTSIYTNSDASIVPVIDDVLRVLVDTNGNSEAHPAGVNTVITSWPLGPRYPLQYSCTSHMIDVTDTIPGLSGWHMGEHSQKAVVPGAACGHAVGKANELSALHYVLVIATIVGLGGDMLITFEGLRGVLQRKPVLTYDIVTGVEQRKMLLFFGAFSTIPSLLFVDVARMYHGTPRYTWFWLLSIVTLGVCAAWISLIFVLAFQRIPSPHAVRYRLAPWSGSIFIHLAIPVVALSLFKQHVPLYRDFTHAPPTLIMTVGGRACPCGAYAPDAIQSAASASRVAILTTIVGCFVFSIAFAMIKLRITHDKWLLDVHWSTDNVFLSTRGIPYWFSGLPLDVRMGLASVAPVATSRKVAVRQVKVAPQEHHGDALYVVSIYGLVLTLAPAWCRLYSPLVYGTVTANTFSRTESKRLPSGKNFVYSRGSVVSSSSRKYNTVRHGNSRVWMRIGSNLVVVFAIYASIASLFILIDMGALDYFTVTLSNAKEEWRPWGQSCALSASGFVPHSCTVVESSVLSTDNAWVTLGQQLARLTPVPTGAIYKVSTCLIGCVGDDKAVSLQLLVGATTYPTCNPTSGSQDIVAMALVEAANVDGIAPHGAYLLTLFSDSSMNRTTTYTNSDGSSVEVIADVVRVLVTTDGASAPYDSGMNWVINSYPLGGRYTIQASCTSLVVDISKDTANRAGWSTGVQSRKAVMTAKSCGHTVTEQLELILVHIVLVVITVVGLGGDMIMTFEGLKGVLQHKPVLTYDILTGVEQRKGLLGIGSVSAFPGMLFFDVGRIYFGTANDTWFYIFAIVTLGVFYAWFALWLLLGLQYIPSPQRWRHQLAPWSPAVFIYGAIPAVAGSVLWSHEELHWAFFDAPPTITMNVSGRLCACGAFDADGIDSAPSLTIGAAATTVVVVFVLSLVYALIKQLYFEKKWLLDTTWTKDNTFLKQAGTPYWFTGLPLDQKDAIRIGNRLFCKPSMQARMGLAAVVPHADKHKVLVAEKGKEIEEVIYLVSVYELVWAILPKYLRLYMPQVHAEITKNNIMPPSHKRLLRSKSYHYSRGTCVG